jgi:hypothetical protein
MAAEEWLTPKTAGLWAQQKAGEILGLEVRNEDRKLLDELDKRDEEPPPERRPGDDGLPPTDEEAETKGDREFETDGDNPVPPEGRDDARRPA